MEKATLTLSIPKKLKQDMNAIKGINWSEEARQFLEQRVQRLRVLQKLDVLTKNSLLTEEDVIKFGEKINTGVAKKHGIKS